MKILLLLLALCLHMNAKENLHSLLKIQLTQKEYLTTLQTMKRKGLLYCINTFKSDGKVLRDIALTEQSLSIEQDFIQTFYQQYPQLLSMKNGWNANKTGNVTFEYIKRYINVNIPFMSYYQAYAPYNRFPISIQKTNNVDYLNSFLQEPITESADYFIPCMQLYDSKEYQEYVVKIIDFIICKNCKSYKTQYMQRYQTMYDSIVGLAKMQGFARCIGHYQENTQHNFNNGYDKITNDIQSGYFLLSHFFVTYNRMYDYRGIEKELDSYIHTIMKHVVKHSGNQSPCVLDCLKLYDSKEYQDEVEHIVKKYCKKCE